MVSARIWIERQIVAMTVRDLLKARMQLSIDRSEEGRSDSEPVTDVSPETIDEIMACDLETLYVGDNGWVLFVYGNDGWDVISDYTTNLEDIIGPILTLAMQEDMEALIAARGEKPGWIERTVNT